MFTLIILSSFFLSSAAAVQECLECVPEWPGVNGSIRFVDCYNSSNFRTVRCAPAAEFACVTILSIGRGIRGCTTDEGCPESKHVYCCQEDSCNNKHTTPSDEDGAASGDAEYVRPLLKNIDGRERQTEEAAWLFKRRMMLMVILICASIILCGFIWIGVVVYRDYRKRRGNHPTVQFSAVNTG